MNVETKQNKQTKFTFLGVCDGRHSGKQIEETKVADTYIYIFTLKGKERKKQTKTLYFSGLSMVILDVQQNADKPGGKEEHRELQAIYTGRKHRWQKEIIRLP